MAAARYAAPVVCRRGAFAAYNASAITPNGETHMKSEKIKYSMGALTAEGALVYDEKVSGKRPAVLMAPNWMGMTDKAIERAKLGGRRSLRGLRRRHVRRAARGRPISARLRGAGQSVARECGRAARAHPRRL